MIKNTGSAEKIRAEIQRRIQESADLGDICGDCDIPAPRKADPATNGGCNWTIDAFPNVKQECLGALKAITSEMMREYELT
jgi:hypothetical protein